MKVTYNGDEKFVSVYGVDFVQGKPVQVADDHPYAFKFKGNPQFTAEGEPEVNEAKKALFAEAEALGLDPRANASEAALQKMIDDKREADKAEADRVALAKKG